MNKLKMMLVGALAVAGAWCAQATTVNVSYVDADGTTKQADATVVAASDSRVTWKAGWYVVTNAVTVTGGADCSGAVHLILADTGKLTISGVADCVAGIGVTGNPNTLAIYGQALGTGALTVTGGDEGAGIGGGEYANGFDITINGGMVTATGGDDDDGEWGGAGIGGGGGCGDGGAGKNITINGGTVTATGGGNGAGIGGGYEGAGSDITINGGKVTATGGKGGAGIGGGRNGIGKNITINGGDVTATGCGDSDDDYDDYGAGIGGGYRGIGSNITINAGTVTANGGLYSAGIGGGYEGAGSDITINGGKVTATGGEADGDYGAGIGSGLDGNDASNIRAADDVIVKAGTKANPTTEIAHLGDQDIAGDLKGKQYATAVEKCTDCITFSSAASFTLKVAYPQWNGKLYWSTDQFNWTEWNGAEVSAAQAGGTGDYHLYVRGNTNNTKISSGSKWTLTGSNVACTGNIETLRGATGDEPSPTKMTEKCYKYMFANCPALTNASALTATNMALECYCQMFYKCGNLKTAPELPATELAEACYSAMFAACTSLTAAPALSATTLAESCYDSMFKGCTSLVVNKAAPGKEWKIPATTGEGATGWGTDMFKNTGGDVPDTPDLNTTYYMGAKKEVVGDVTLYRYGDQVGVSVAGELTKALADSIKDQGITNLIVGTGVTGVGDGAFEGWRSLRDVTISTNCTAIGEDAFHRCQNVTNVTVQAEEAVAVGDYAFYRCNSLEQLSFAHLPSWGETPFSFYSAIYMKDGVPEVYAIPNVEITGYGQVLKGSNDLETWTTVTDETKKDYKFFKIVLEAK